MELLAFLLLAISTIQLDNLVEARVIERLYFTNRGGSKLLIYGECCKCGEVYATIIAHDEGQLVRLSPDGKKYRVDITAPTNWSRHDSWISRRQLVIESDSYRIRWGRERRLYQVHCCDH